jgi:hypothetical protein
MGLIESAITIGDLREAYRVPIHSRLSKCVGALDTLREEVGVEVERPRSSVAPALPPSAPVLSLNMTEGPNPKRKQLEDGSGIVEPVIASVSQCPKRSLDIMCDTQRRVAPPSSLRCIRCGTLPMWGGAACQGWIKEAGAPCCAFNGQGGQEQLRYYRSQYYWKCPRETCAFIIPRSGVPVSDQINRVLTHEQNCIHPHVVRTYLPV